jgi:hypothetical protein
MSSSTGSIGGEGGPSTPGGSVAMSSMKSQSNASDMSPMMEVPSGFQQHPIYQHPMSTPWTLGSTDGTYAIQLQLMQQQQLAWNAATNGADMNDAATTSSAGSADKVLAAGAAVEVVANSSPPQTPVQQQQQVQSGGGGAAIAPTGEAAAASTAALETLQGKQSLYQDRLFRQPSASVEAVLAASCEVMGFDISEMWLRTGPKTHQLTNSHLRPTALEDSVRKDLVDVYYGDKSCERTHRLSPALCKRAKEANDVVWITAHTQHGVEALRCSISNVRTAVAVPVCHEASNTNITIIFFSIRRYVALCCGACCMLWSVEFGYSIIVHACMHDWTNNGLRLWVALSIYCGSPYPFIPASSVFDFFAHYYCCCYCC